jgi:hypothetical protein
LTRNPEAFLDSRFRGNDKLSNKPENFQNP